MSRWSERLLTIDELSISFRDDEGGRNEVVRDFSLQMSPGEVVALIGESGSGKTMAARSIPRLLPVSAQVAGSIFFRGIDMIGDEEAVIRDMRGRDIGFVFQEPLVALNPALTIGEQLDEGLCVDRSLTADDRRSTILSTLERLRVPRPHRCLTQYPHEFSGGMRQRIVIASAMMRRPALVVADEPTTALDALIQGEVLELMLELARDSGSAVLLITHDLGVVADVAEQVLVMEKGRVVERGPAKSVLSAPEHRYTRKLLGSLPIPATEPAERLDDPVLVSVEQARVVFSDKARFLGGPAKTHIAVNDVTLDVRVGETLAVVGESGSGKTTIARALLGLAALDSGRILFDGIDVSRAKGRDLIALRQRVQLIFQDPFSSLDPRMCVVDAVTEALHFRRLSWRERRTTALAILEKVGVDAAMAERYPHELSGGQRQRVCIARALAVEPDLVVADEAVSALDLTVQARVLALLTSLQQEIGFAMMFISHDLAVVGEIADRILVMCNGHPLELGASTSIFKKPLHPYTRELLMAGSFLQAAGAENRYVLQHWEPSGGLPELPLQPFPIEASDAVERLMFEFEPGHFVALSGAANSRPTARAVDSAVIDT